MRKVFWAALATVLLGACATKPVTDLAASNAPAQRVYAHQLDVTGGALLVVTRDAGFSGSACSVAVLIDGVVAATLEQGERVSFHLPAGEAILGIRQAGSKLCGLAEDRMRRETSVSLPAGATKKYRIGIGASGEPFVAPTTY
ncbi:hypothetical protein [Xanthomonas translucens]|nr:hypothetical protein [Xanthomonas translucens]QSQ34677.1 hypothetical protein ISN31_03360 [Xanthomonas translucens pv. translucens]UPU47790.1 hypothetical protein MZO50_13610 [Xanthomonas translucens pv. undulosa]WLA06523.1 hypothetical protein MO329_09735 [Xanthomonas translucens]